jgi:signal transduction histidine kinase
MGAIVRLVGGEAQRRGVTLRTDLGPSLPAIAADRVSLQQVMLNLMMNATDAMDQLKASERLVILHGGSIWAEDQGGRGATFRLSLPALVTH